MRTANKIWLSIAVILCLTTLTRAQETINCDQMRTKLTQLEQLEMSGISPSLQQLYKESLLKLYTQFSKCLQGDIAAATEIQRTVAGTDAAVAVQNRVQALKSEKTNVDGKIILLAEALNLSTTPVTPSDSSSAEAISNSRSTGSAPLQDPVSASGSPAGLGSTRSTDRPPAHNPVPATTVICVPGGMYEQAPMLLTDIVSRDVTDAVNKNDPDLATASANLMILYAIIDAASPASSDLLRGLEAYKYLGETARTDKQLGSAANSNGAVSAIEKPGFASLLGFAVEHGAINKENDGTNLTLSSSLYSLYAFNKGHTAETYKRAGILNRVGVAATFAVDDQTSDLANARRNNLIQWSVKARLFGDRSTRSAGYQKFWKEQIEPLISARLLALGGAIEGLAKEENIPGYDQLEEDLTLCIVEQVKKRMDESDYKAATVTERQKFLSDLILGLLKSRVYDAIKSGQIKVSPNAITLIETQYVPSLKLALDNLKKAGGEVETKLEELKKAPLGTFSYTNYRIPTGSDYSETKFLFEQDQGFMGPLKLTGNLGLSFYNKPNQSLNQQRLRDITAALAFGGSTRSPFIETENQSRITFSFVGRYERLFENEQIATRTPDIGSLQFVTEIPFIKGLSLPLSVTYSNATEEEKKQGFRFNFGIRLDTDKLFDLLKAKP
jgi:hypothetical protein